MTELTRRGFLKGVIAATGLMAIGVDFERDVMPTAWCADTMTVVINGAAYDIVMADIRNEFNALPEVFGAPLEIAVPRIVGTTISLTVNGACDDPALWQIEPVPFSIPWGRGTFSGEAVCGNLASAPTILGNVETIIDLRVKGGLRYDPA